MITFVVEGVPVPKARARVVMRGKFPSAYTPKPSKDYENLVSIAAKSAMNKAGIQLTESPCKVKLFFSMPVPASTSKKKTDLMNRGYIKHTKKPDLDNMIKNVMDALNGIVWKDDSQVVVLEAMKYYNKPNLIVHIEIIKPDLLLLHGEV